MKSLSFIRKCVQGAMLSHQRSLLYRYMSLSHLQVIFFFSFFKEHYHKIQCFPTNKYPTFVLIPFHSQSHRPHFLDNPFFFLVTLPLSDAMPILMTQHFSFSSIISLSLPSLSLKPPSFYHFVESFLMCRSQNFYFFIFAKSITQRFGVGRLNFPGSVNEE